DAGAHVVEAGADAQDEARFGVETEELALAEAAVKVVASAGGDEGLVGVGAGNPRGAGGGGAGGGFARVDDDGGDAELFADGGGGCAEAGLVFFGGGEFEYSGDLLGFLEIEAEGDVAEGAEA